MKWLCNYYYFLNEKSVKISKYTVYKLNFYMNPEVILLKQLLFQTNIDIIIVESNN
jgi:hypothetical protein